MITEKKCTYYCYLGAAFRLRLRESRNAHFQPRPRVSYVDDVVAPVIPGHYTVIETRIFFVFNRFSGGSS